MGRLKAVPGRIASAPSKVAAAPKTVEPFYRSKGWRELVAARRLDADYFAALRRAKANTGGVAEMTGLSRAVNAATAAGATDEELLGEARKLLSRKGSEEEQEVARLCARLEKFEKLAAIGEGGERDNAEAMAAQARAKLEELGYSMSKK